LPEELSLSRAADHLRDPRSADVGGMGKDIMHRLRRAVTPEIPDRKPRHPQRPARVDHVVDVVKAEFNGLRDGEGFEDTAQFIDALNRAIEQRAVGLIAFDQGARSARWGQNPAGSPLRRFRRCVRSIKTAAAPRAFISIMPPARTSSTVGLHRQVDRQRQGRGAGRVAQVFVKKGLDARDPNDLSRVHSLLAKARAAQNMRRQTAIWVKPHLSRAEMQARLTQIVHQSAPAPG
jgi:hypothetical protein